MDDSQDDAELDPAEAELEDEEGFTLEELSQAYLGIVGGVSENSGPLHESDNEIEIFEDEKVDEDQDRYQVTPQNILEAILFVARPDDTHVGIQEITSVMRGVTEEDVLHWVDQLNAIYEETGKRNSYSAITARAGVSTCRWRPRHSGAVLWAHKGVEAQSGRH